MPYENHLPDNWQKSFLSDHRKAISCTWAVLYDEWATKKTLHGYDSAHLEDIREALGRYDQAGGYWQRFRIRWKLWRLSGFSSLSYYRNLIAFRDQLVQLIGIYQSLLKTSALKKSQDLLERKTGEEEYAKLIKAYRPNAAASALDKFGTKLEGLFSRLKRFINVRWGKKMVSSRKLVTEDRQDAIEMQLMDSDIAGALLPVPAEEKEAPSLALRSQSNWTQLANWFNRQVGRPISDAYFQQLSAANLKKMRHFIAMGITNLPEGDFIGLCQLKLQLEATYKRYKHRYQPAQIKGQGVEKLKAINDELDSIYRDELGRLLQLIEEKRSTYLEAKFSWFKLDLSENSSIALKQDITRLIREVHSRYEKKDVFYHDHLCLLLRETLREVKTAALGLTTSSEQPIVNGLVHWLNKIENELLHSTAPKKIDDNVKIFYESIINGLIDSKLNIQEEIEKICSNQNDSFEDRARAVYALKIKWHRLVATAECIWRAHPWDESEPHAVAWSNQALRIFADLRASDAVDKKIEELSPPIAKWIAAQSQLILAEDKDYLKELKDNSLLDYVFYCSFFGFDWEQPLSVHDVQKAFQQLSLKCHPDKMPIYNNPNSQKAAEEFLTAAFNLFTIFRTRLVKLLGDREKLLKSSDRYSLWVINQYVTAGKREFQSFLKHRGVCDHTKMLEEEKQEILKETAKYKVAQEAAEAKLRATQEELRTTQEKLRTTQEKLRTAEAQLKASVDESALLRQLAAANGISLPNRPPQLLPLVSPGSASALSSQGLFSLPASLPALASGQPVVSAVASLRCAQTKLN